MGTVGFNPGGALCAGRAIMFIVLFFVFLATFAY